MRIIISESQLKNILKEDLSLNNSYLNKILDKMLLHGKESLTPEEKEALSKMSGGENVQEPDDDDAADYDMGNNDSNVIGEPDAGDIGFMDKEVPRSLDNLPYRMFVDLFPRESIDVFNPHNRNDRWITEMVEKDAIETIILYNDKKGYYIIPFWDEDKVIVNDENNKLLYSMTIESRYVPDDEESMHKFINSFIKSVLPAIISKGNR